MYSATHVTFFCLNFNLGLSAKECAASFWDAVVFSVCDKAQREAFHEHIARFKQSATIPLVDYLAIEDVPQYKMGKYLRYF